MHMSLRERDQWVRDMTTAFLAAEIASREELADNEWDRLTAWSLSRAYRVANAADDSSISGALR